MPPQFAHERLAEAHDLDIALALWVEVRSALASTHRKRGQGVLEDLLEPKEFEDSQIDTRMEAETALVGTDRTIHLDPEATIYVDLTGVIDPGDTEHDYPFGFNHPFQDLGLANLQVVVEDRIDRLDDFVDRLVEFGFTGKPSTSYMRFFSRNSAT